MDKSPITYVDLIGTPFRRGARGPDEFDCYGLVKFLIERATGREVPDYQSPTDSGATHALISNGLFIHAWEPSGGVTIERLSEWEKRIDGFYEYIEG
jgi:cell wall-associated NlpC family hydrolase